MEGVHLKLNYKGLNFLSNISLIPGTVFETIDNIKVKAFFWSYYTRFVTGNSRNSYPNATEFIWDLRFRN